MKTYLVRTLTFSFLVMVAPGLSGQGKQEILARASNPQAGHKGNYVRWTEPEIDASLRVNVYRQEDGQTEWEKLNAAPFGFGAVTFSKEELKANPEIDALMAVATKITKGEATEGLLKSFVLYRAITIPKFGTYLGILYHDTTAVPGKRYRYEVKRASNEKSMGVSNVITTGKYVPEGPPPGIRSEAKDESARITWIPDDHFVSYNLYLSTSKGGSKPLYNKEPILPTRVANELGVMAYPEWLFLLDSLVNGTTYYASLSRIDLFGYESERSKEFEFKPHDMRPPKHPSDLELIAKGYDVSITWKAAEESDLVGFNVYGFVMNRDTSLKLLNTKALPKTSRNFEHKVRDLNLVYGFIIEAIDQSGNTSRSKEGYVQVYDVEPPKVPTGLVAVADTGVIKLSWATNKEQDLRGYRIYRGFAGAEDRRFVLLTPQPVTGTVYNDTLPKRAKNKFAYKVTANDTVYNESEKTAAVIAQMPDIVPPQSPFISGIKAEGKTITLTWQPNLEDDLMGYMVERAISDADTAKWTRITPGPLSKTATTYTDKAVAPKVKYYYRLQAMDVSKNPSGYSNVYMGFVTDMKMETAPADVAAQYEASKKAVVLKWRIEASSDLAGCMVFRKEGNAEFLPISGLLTENQFADATSTKGKKYFYEVRAFDKAGNAAKSPIQSIEIPQTETK